MKDCSACTEEALETSLTSRPGEETLFVNQEMGSRQIPKLPVH